MSYIKYLQIIFLIFFLYGNSNCQILANYGVKVGLSYSNINTNYQQTFLNDATDFKIGVSGVVFTKSSFSKHFHLVSEIGYIQKGYKEKFNKYNMIGEKIGEFTIKERFDYLTIKIQPCYEYEIKSVTPYIFFGPKLDFNLMVDNKIKTFSKLIKESQFGISYGFGIKLNRLLPYNILVELNSNYDFDNSFKNDFVAVKNISYELKIGLEL